MAKQMFINLPVKDLAKSRVFFEALGYQFNPHFSDDTAACLVLGDTIYAMLLTEPKFSSFTKKPISDAGKATEVIIALDCQSRAEVDDIISKAVAAGGSIYRDADDHGFMYGHSFADLDGHQWEFFYMDPEAIPK
ncbi:MAG: glyoxalase/bleomycin resistance/extradiol dioxygenase family protein [Chitinophagaceae bacterium]|nr:MAG: glyoxalase/bleomycin resistance/extradiol dioxygenase family protein [Chitinophagaceae bacterium]